jgi:large subunit ribosomal protein L33
MRDTIHLQCGACKRRNYSTTKNKKKQQGKLEVRKYCPFCRSHQVHKEVK